MRPENFAEFAKFVYKMVGLSYYAQTKALSDELYSFDPKLAAIIQCAGMALLAKMEGQEKFLDMLFVHTIELSHEAGEYYDTNKNVSEKAMKELEALRLELRNKYADTDTLIEKFFNKGNENENGNES